MKARDSVHIGESTNSWGEWVPGGGSDDRLVVILAVHYRPEGKAYVLNDHHKIIYGLERAVEKGYRGAIRLPIEYFKCLENGEVVRHNPSRWDLDMIYKNSDNKNYLEGIDKSKFMQGIYYLPPREKKSLLRRLLAEVWLDLA